MIAAAAAAQIKHFHSRQSVDCWSLLSTSVMG